MQRLRLVFFVFCLLCGLGLQPRLVAAAGGSPSTGGSPATGGAPGVGGQSVRRHIGPMVQGTSYLTYFSWFCLALVALGALGSFRSTRV